MHPTVEPEDLVITHDQIRGLVEVDIIGRTIQEFAEDLTDRGWTVIPEEDVWWTKRLS